MKEHFSLKLNAMEKINGTFFVPFLFFFFVCVSFVLLFVFVFVFLFL